MLRNHRRNDRNALRRKPRRFPKHGLFGGFRNGDELIHTAQRPSDPNLFHQPPLPTVVIVNESNVVNGQNQVGTVSPPFWPSECGEINVTRDVQDVCIDCPGLSDDLPTAPPAFAEVCRLDPFWRGFLWPSIGNFSKRLLNAEVPEGAFFAEKPGDAHQEVIVFVAMRMDNRYNGRNRKMWVMKPKKVRP